MKLECDWDDQDVIRNTVAKRKGFGCYLLFSPFGLVEVSENKTKFMRLRMFNLNQVRAQSWAQI